MTFVGDAGVRDGNGIATEPPGGSWRGDSILERWTNVDIVCALLVVVFVCEMTTGQANRYSPTLAPLVAIVPLGLVMLVRDAWGGDRASRLAVGVLIGGLISVLVSAAPMVSLLGASQRHTSWLVFAGGFSAFALARRVSSNGEMLVAGAFVFAVCLSGTMAIIEVLVQPTNPTFALIDARPRGLTLHPVYLAQFSAGVCGLACWRIVKGDKLVGYVLVGVMSLLVGLTASRVAMLSVLAFVALTVLLVQAKSRRGWLLPVVAFLGVATSWLFHSGAGTSRSVVDRAASEGIQERFDLWGYGLQGWVERPVFGWGPGRFAIATQGYLDPEFVRRFETIWWDDAHNVLVEILTSWGLVGLILFFLFALVMARSCKGPMFWVAGAVAASWMLEPATPATLGVLGITLGIASTPTFVAAKPERLGRQVQLVLVGVGVLASSLILVGGTRSRLVDARITTDMVDGVSIWYRYDWVLAAFYAEVLPNEPPRDEIKRFWARRALDLEPESGLNHAVIGLIAFEDDDLVGARVAAERALELQPTHELGLIVLHNVAVSEGDLAQAAELTARLCKRNPGVYCDFTDAQG